ncbi:hypothetical protein [Methylomonas albis]|uniref:RHS repeat protein n=1 Tax=Methylomonas albis TaxID=1854563 RepID=A0ABR9CWE7_9GAMM|nr:RHS repeat-associated core domain-containing protein [Methylomonas albis]MBD9355187.1 RHS repeat protein [Methylomonas albis]CAD6878134.1 hypothetical protein [Methylomonas albis]
MTIIVKSGSYSHDTLVMNQQTLERCDSGRRSFRRLIGFIALSLALGIILQFPAPVFAVQPANCELPDGDIDGDECITQNPSKNNGGNNSCDTSCTPKLTAEPINVATGNKYEDEVDYLSGGPSPLALRRSYNSFDNAVTSFGIGWRGDYNRSISGTSFTVDVTRNDGKVLTFILAGSAWVSDSDVNAKLVKLATGWQYTTGLDGVEIYNASGKLISITDRKGLTQTLTYDSQGRLSTVTNPFGRSLTFAYSGTDTRVSSVKVPNGGVYAYSYDSKNNLSTVTYPDNTQRKYLYENPSYPHALTGIIDEKGVRYATDAYDSQGRDVSNELAGGVNKYTLDYNFLTYGYVPVKDALGVTRTSTFTNVNDVALETLMTQSCPSCPVGYARTKTTTSYDANGNIISQTDFNANTTNYSYDTTRNLEISRTEAAGKPQARTITTTWHSTFRLPTKIVEPNRVMAFSYDAKGNLLQKTITAGAQTKSWTFTYNANGQPLTIDGPRTDVSDFTRFSYDAQGNLTTITDALSHVTTIASYNADGQPLSIKDPNGLVTSFQYDPRGRLLASTVGTETTQYSYDVAGQLIKLTLPDATYLAYSYDDAHRLISIADSQGNHIDYALDKMGNKLKTTVNDPSNTLTSTRTQVFDGLSRLAKSIGAQNQVTQFGYDPNGNTTSLTDPLNNKTALAYDSLNRLISSVDPLGKTTNSNYDSNDNLLAVTDPLTHQTGYGYDGFGQRLTIDSPDTGHGQVSYDDAGNPISVVDARGQTVSYSYDALNRIIQIRYASKPPINFAYDQGANGLGHLTQMTEGAGSTVTNWAYDARGRVTSKTFKSGSLKLVTSYGYGSDGRLVSLAYPSGQTLHVSYNSNGQVATLDSNGTPILSDIHYQPFGGASDWTFGNGVKTTRSFDLDGRLLAYDLGDRSRQLTYDAAGRITGYTDTDLNHDQSFSYDELGRLTNFSDPASQISYSYDANGNRLQQSDSTLIKNFSLDTASNRLLGITDNTNQILKNYSYDAAGHITADGYNSFTYDGRGRLVQAANVGIGVEQYLINGLGQRVAKVYGGAPDLAGDADQDGSLTTTDLRLIVLMTQGAVPVNLAADCSHDGKVTAADASCTQAKIIDMRTNPGKYVQAGTYFVYDGAGHVLGEYTQTGAPIQETIWLGNMPVAVSKGSNQYFVYADHLNAPRAISDNTGKVIWRWDSEAFGTTAANEDPDGDSNIFTYNLRFPGQYYDKSTGLHYNGFRDYNPAIGRYIESDPIGLAGGVNSYAYAYGNPLTYDDFFGLCDVERCNQLRKKIFEKNAKLLNELRKYDPIADGKGGFSFPGGFTKPGGHYKEINDLKRGITNDTTEYRKLGCDDDEGNGGTGSIPRSIFDTVNRPVPEPVYPESTSPSVILPNPPSPSQIAPWILIPIIIILSPVGA